MDLVLTQEGALLLWQFMLSIVNPLPLRLHLLGNPFTPTHTSVYANFAANELAVPGYAPINLAAPAAPWAFLAIPSGQEAINQPDPFNFLAGCTVYGWWLSDSADGKSVFGAKWDPPYVFGDLGGQFYVALQPSLVSVP